VRLIDGDYLADLIRHKIDINRIDLSELVLAIMEGFASTVDLSPTIDPLEFETFSGTVMLDGMIKEPVISTTKIVDGVVESLIDGPSLIGRATVASGGVPFPTNVPFDPLVERGSFNGGVSYYLPKEPKKKHKKKHKAWVKECDAIRADVQRMMRNSLFQNFLGDIDNPNVVHGTLPLGVVRGSTSRDVSFLSHLNWHEVPLESCETTSPVTGSCKCGDPTCPGIGPR
jgi:hypothetical protein